MKRDSSELATSFAVLIVGENLQKEELRDGTREHIQEIRKKNVWFVIEVYIVWGRGN